MLSLGKLAQFAHLQEGGTLDEGLLDGMHVTSTRVLGCSCFRDWTGFHDGLDFVAVQEKLRKEFQNALTSLRGKQKQSQDAQVEMILSAKASRLNESEKRGLVLVRFFAIVI